MNNKILIVVAVIVILALVLFFAPRPETEETTELPVREQPEIIVHSLALNGMTDPQIVLSLGDKSVITATIENPGQEEAEVVMSVRMDGELFDNRHDWTYVLQPGEIREIEEVREKHFTWYPGVFTIEVGDRVIEVTVQGGQVD